MVIRHSAGELPLLRSPAESPVAQMMNKPFSPLRLAMVSLTGASLFTSCDKPEAAPAPAAPAVVTAPAPAPAADPVGAIPEVPAPAAAETPAPAPVAGDAVEAFKAEIKAIKTFMEANEETKDASVGLANLKELVKRANAVKTDGLPADLAEAYQEMTGVMNRLQGTLDDLPVPVDQLQTYMTTEAAKGGAAAEEVAAKLAAFQTAMKTHQDDGEAASAKLKEVGAKYGIESLDLSGK